MISILTWVYTMAATLLYKYVGQVRYYFKFTFMALFILVSSFILNFVWIFRPRNVLNSLHATPLFHFLSKCLGIEWEISGKEHITGEFSCIVLVNHQSVIDVLGGQQMWFHMKKAAMVVKKELLYVFPFGTAGWLSGTLFVDRSKGEQSRKNLEADMETFKANQIKLVMTPEGTRRKGRTLSPFKKGAFRIAILHGIPIVPVVISPYTFINDSKKIFNSGKVLSTILPPVETSEMELTEENVQKLIDTVWDMMNEEFIKLTGVVEELAGSSAVHEFVC